MEGEALTTSHISPHHPISAALPCPSNPFISNTLWGVGILWAAGGGRFAGLFSRTRRYLVRGTAALSGKGNCKTVFFCLYTHRASSHKDLKGEV